MPPSEAVVQTILSFRQRGVSLRLAAAAAGVHVATVCRWQNRDPALRQALREAAQEGREPEEPRPSVRWRRDCPLCRAKVVVRSARGKVPFWRCGRWPLCPWASWRPREARDCRHCGSPRYWSHSRKSIACGGCGRRTAAP
jgi:hypothetical protein